MHGASCTGRWGLGVEAGGTHHVMLEDSLHHGGEHLDDYHGPGPLSAVLGREWGIVTVGLRMFRPPGLLAGLETVSPVVGAWVPLMNTVAQMSLFWRGGQF